MAKAAKVNSSYVWISVIALFFIAMAVSVYIFGNIFLNKSIDSLVRYAVSMARTKGVIVGSITYKKAGFSSFDTIAWKDISISGKITPYSSLGGKISADHQERDENFTTSIDKITLTLKKLSDRTFSVAVTGADTSIYITSKMSRVDNAKLRCEEFETYFRLNSLDAKMVIADIKKYFTSITDIMKDGKADIPFEFSGSMMVLYNNVSTRVGIHSLNRDKKHLITMDRNDARKACKIMGEEVWDSELNIICDYPMRLASIIRLRDQARRAAHERYESDPLFPEKAYRHVLWNYLLAKQYGEEFTERLTSAHEDFPDQDDVIGEKSAIAVKEMDLANNVVGRRYAENGYTEDSIESRMMTDPDVILSPQ